jgi:hypothetical protein
VRAGAFDREVPAGNERGADAERDQSHDDGYNG